MSKWIKKKKDYQAVYQKHQKKTGRCFIVLYNFECRYLEDHYGIVVSKKVGKAVVRNKIKRRVRAFIRNYLASMKRSLHVIIIAKKGAAKASWLEIKEDLDALLFDFTDEYCK